MKAMLIAISGILLVALSYAIGLSIGEKKAITQAAILIDSAQADLLFNKLTENKEVIVLLSKGCVSQAKKKLDVSVDQDTDLLARFFKEKLSPESIKYIVDRDPALVNALKNFRSKYGNSWTEMACNN